MTQESSITFQFPDYKSAVSALDTLEELGCESNYHEMTAGHAVHIHLERNDLTSALEIAQSHGGSLVEHPVHSEQDVFQSAYSMDAIRIPAHTVNEDWPEAYTDPNNESIQSAAAVDDDLFTVSELADESYNHFSADVHA